jgi:hypothetical protein
MLRFLALLTLLFSPMLAGCPPYFTDPGPPMVSVNQWSGTTVILDRLVAEVGPQAEISEAYLQLSDPDGDGSFPLEAVAFLVHPQSWAVPYLDPLNLYTASVQTDPALSPNGVMARVMSANKIRDSLTTIFTP